MKQTYKIFFAILAVMASLCFIVLAGQIFTHLYLGAEDSEGIRDFFRDDIVVKGLTSPLAMLTILIPWIAAAMYYYVVNSVHFDRWWHWGIVLVLTGLATFYSSWQFMSSHLVLENNDGAYSPYILSLAGWCALLSGGAYLLASYGIRWWSSNCRHTPIPQ